MTTLEGRSNTMQNTPVQNLLDAILDSWDRNNTILVNLLSALPEGGLEAGPLTWGVWMSKKQAQP